MPNAKPSGLNQMIGINSPAETVESNICMNACPEAAVPLSLGNLSSAAIDSIGVVKAMPMLYKTIGKIFQNGLAGNCQQIKIFKAIAAPIQQ